MIQKLPLEALFTPAANVYARVRGVVGGVRKIWNPTLNTGAGGWEVWNPANVAQYAVALTDDGTGYYSADFPANISGVITSETYYNNAAPNVADAPITGIQYSQGRNMNGAAGDPAAAANVQLAAGAAIAGAASGSPTNQVIPTNLSTADAAAAVGGSLIFAASAAGAPRCSGRVVGSSGSTLTLAAPLPAVPVAGDLFVVE